MEFSRSLIEEVSVKKFRSSDGQIIAVLKQAEAGTPVPELCREHGICAATFYKWAPSTMHGSLDGVAHEEVGGGKPPAEEDVCRGTDEHRHSQGGTRTKW